MFIQRGQYPPIGSIIGWVKSLTGTPSLPDGWLECNGQTISDAGSPYNGQTLPDLFTGMNIYFLRGSASSGSIGGSVIHQHFSPSSWDSTTSVCAYISCALTVIDGSVSPDVSYPGYNFPTLYTVVWVVRIK
jgi:hypothetical protein